MLLEVNQISKSFQGPEGTVRVLREIDLTLDAGETLALTGESGSGKSTLLHLIGGLETADSGAIHLDGQDITKLDDAGRARVRRTEVGVIFQQFNLIPSLSVQSNISFHARLAGKEYVDRTETLAKHLGLTPHLHKFPEALSGGQQQRVAIARTLCAQPKLILADEPTGNLDEGTASNVLAEMLDLVKETGVAMMVVTHSPVVAGQMDRRLNLRKGRLA